MLRPTLFAAIAFVVLPASVTRAGLVYGTSAAGELSGSRSNTTDGGLSGPVAGATVSWNVVENLDVSFTYTYAMTNFTGRGAGVSHFTLDITDDAVGDDDAAADPNAVTNATFNGAAIPGNLILFNDFEGIAGAVKFDLGDDGDVTYSFTSNRSPVYGNLNIKTGAGDITNVGLGSEGTSMIANHFVVRPNGVAVPEPSAFLYGGLIATLAGVGYRMKRRLR